MPLVPNHHVRRDVCGPDRLIEPERDDDRLIESPVQAVPVRLQQPHGRRGERERERTAKRASADRRGVAGDGHVIARRAQQRRLRVCGEHEQRGARPPERAGHRRADREEWGRNLVRQPADRHHRLGEADAHFRRLVEVCQFSGGLASDDGENGLRARRDGGRQKRQYQDDVSNSHV